MPSADAPAPDWRLFLRALAEEIDATASPDARDSLLRGVGGRMAGSAPLPAVTTLDALEIEMNDALRALGWGRAGVTLDSALRMVRIEHTGLPRIGSMAGPQGPWLSAVLEGLYGIWFAEQPGADRTLTARRDAGGGSGTRLTLTYGRHPA